MNLENYIKMLFSDQEIVIVPELGAFLVAKDETLGTTGITFNPDMTVNDGLLSGIISRYESISEEEALLKIESFVAKILKEVSQNKSYSIDEFGKFYYDWKNSIGFDLDEEVANILQNKESDEGSETIISDKNIDSENTEENEELETEKKKGFKLMPILFIIIPILIVGTIATLIFTKKLDVSFITNMLTKKEVVEEEEEPVTEETTTETITEAPANPAPSKSVSSAGSAEKGRYYVIAGGFSSEENAQKYAQTINSGEVKVLAPSNNNLYRVSLFDSDNFKDANAKVQELNSSYNNSLWVHKSF